MKVFTEEGMRMPGRISIGVSACLPGGEVRFDGGQKCRRAYRRGDYPLIVTVRLLQHHFPGYPHACVSQQVYLNPHPQSLGLRNRI